MSQKRQSLRQIFALPLAAAVASFVGLLAALVADGAGDVVSWVALGAPVVLVGWATARRRS